MYVVLGHEIADVDQSEFDRVGSCNKDVIAIPGIDVTLGMKGMRTGAFDRMDECQNTVHITYSPPYHDEDIDSELHEDPFKPGLIYQQRSDGAEFVELRYDYDLGSLTVNVYFLVSVHDCIFGHRFAPDKIAVVDYAYLQDEQLIRKLE